MTEPAVIIRFDGNGRTYLPGDTLSGEYHVEGVSAEDVKAVEISVLWQTEGKGDGDLAVHHFERLSAEEGGWLQPPTFGQFHTVLPNSPLSYEGVIIKLGWCVRVRVFLTRGREVVGEAPFRLGNVPAAKATPP